MEERRGGGEDVEERRMRREEKGRVEVEENWRGEVEGEVEEEVEGEVDERRREGERRNGGRRGWRDSNFGIPPNNSVAHGLDMRHRILFFIFFIFFDFAGKIHLLAITFFSF